MATLQPSSIRGLSSERHASPRRDLKDDHRAVLVPRKQHRAQLVLLFDGTGNKFSGTDADSNILKIYRCLARNREDQFHYYQPGIGTYVSTSSLSHTSHWARFKSWYLKAKDSAIGTSFDEHVMGGYKFLMRYYSPGDDIYFFGFSRGAYTAKFVAEMLDHVGLLSAGNEEMARFAWKTFQKWQQRRGGTPEEKREKDDLLGFMCAFRETFSRPVHRIRFLGLFDTVNSVPKFENAWMQRSKFPYTVRSTAKVIRHAVAIDERRAKFRQDLISEVRTRHQSRGRERYHSHHKRQTRATNKETAQSRGRKAYDPIPTYRIAPYRDPSEIYGVRSRSPRYKQATMPGRATEESLASVSQSSLAAIARPEDAGESSDEELNQDIQEVWFPGCHADIGGGWPLDDSDDAALSHLPLVWMIREAMRAGLHLDEEKLRRLRYCGESIGEREDEPLRHHGHRSTQATGPEILLRAPTMSGTSVKNDAVDTPDEVQIHSSEKSDVQTANSEHTTDSRSDFHRLLDWAATKGRIHDVLQFNNGASALGVMSWNIMEYMPFRRMDLRQDGSWEAIIWPLPKGEVRDIPHDAVIHNSVIRRMEVDESYRPGNLIIGGGGRGVRRAPEELGMGKWKVCKEKGDVVGECYVRSEKIVMQREATASTFGVRPGGPQGVFITRS